MESSWRFVFWWTLYNKVAMVYCILLLSDLIWKNFKGAVSYCWECHNNKNETLCPTCECECTRHFSVTSLSKTKILCLSWINWRPRHCCQCWWTVWKHFVNLADVCVHDKDFTEVFLASLTKTTKFWFWFFFKVFSVTMLKWEWELTSNHFILVVNRWIGWLTA